MSCADHDCGCGPAAANKPAGEPEPGAGRWVSVYRVPKMDCPAEERMIRMALASCEGVRQLAFDLPNRTLTVVHDCSVDPLSERLVALGLGARLTQTQAAETAPGVRVGSTQEQEAATLKVLLAINAIMFIFELVAGLVAQSTGLIGDSLDMFADAAVYGVALYAVGRAARLQMRAAQLAGWLQGLLALGLLVEVGRRFFSGSEPQSLMIMAVSCVALIANVACLLLIARHRDGGVHMKASYIFSANDVLINVGVIVAGGLVAWTGSNYPDLFIGGLIGLVVLLGARRILALRA
ncbi:cation transporter [Pseudomonas songnenensis]|uniref:Cation transporter n=1 Tax=Pseudomonas songnenensis TaxID=1176259 RepID=A0ABX9USN1_9PSED|nr:cation transporter [Pseudomonas songnenensis]MCQ4299178.1 cation transporter [Pseudomonas songnenensis]OCX94508.1 MAG: sodium:proton antiporter [Pseudomonas sp. CO183]RMH96172.1 cation transporter [Pseudomonas songnenensis]